MARLIIGLVVVLLVVVVVGLLVAYLRRRSKAAEKKGNNQAHVDGAEKQAKAITKHQERKLQKYQGGFEVQSMGLRSYMDQYLRDHMYDYDAIDDEPYQNALETWELRTIADEPTNSDEEAEAGTGREELVFKEESTGPMSKGFAQLAPCSLLKRAIVAKGEKYVDGRDELEFKNLLRRQCSPAGSVVYMCNNMNVRQWGLKCQAIQKAARLDKASPDELEKRHMKAMREMAKLEGVNPKDRPVYGRLQLDASDRERVSRWYARRADRGPLGDELATLDYMIRKNENWPMEGGEGTVQYPDRQLRTEFERAVLGGSAEIGARALKASFDRHGNTEDVYRNGIATVKRLRQNRQAMEALPSDDKTHNNMDNTLGLPQNGNVQDRIDDIAGKELSLSFQLTEYNAMRRVLYSAEYDLAKRGTDTLRLLSRYYAQHEISKNRATDEPSQTAKVLPNVLCKKTFTLEDIDALVRIEGPAKVWAHETAFQLFKAENAKATLSREAAMGNNLRDAVYDEIHPTMVAAIGKAK